jgi:hypothetical protein
VYQSSVLQGLFRSILSDPSAAQVDGQSLYKLSSKEDAMDLTALLPLLLGANTQKAAPQKNFVTDILPILVQLISALAQRSAQSNAKALAGNDAMLLPTMLATMLNAARQPDPSAQKSIGADPLSALLPTLLPLLLKGRADQPASQKLFGIDDAILIPAIVSLVTAATKQAQAPAQAETKRFDFNSLLPVITPILQSKAQELVGQDNRSMIDNALFIPAVAAVMSAAVQP